MPLPDAVLDAEALDLLTHEDDGDDDDASVREDHEDDTLYHDADVSLNELRDLHSDAAPMDPPPPLSLLHMSL